MLKRRKLITAFGMTVLTATGTLSVAPVQAQELFNEGVDYQRLPSPVPTSSGDKIEVVEIFWYGCPHCFRLEPAAERWLANKPENVEFVRVPGVGGRWSLGAAAYYVAQNLDVVDKVHQAMFDALHVKRQEMSTIEHVAAFFAEHGIDGAKFDKSLNSFEVKTNMQRAQKLMRNYQITGVPALIVNGKYKTSSFDVVDFLVRKESDSS